MKLQYVDRALRADICEPQSSAFVLMGRGDKVDQEDAGLIVSTIGHGSSIATCIGAAREIIAEKASGARFDL